MTASEAMRRNALLLEAFCLKCESRGLKVLVGLSGETVSERPPNDLVVHVRSTGGQDRDPIRLAERVTGRLDETLALLEAQIGMGPVAG